LNIIFEAWVLNISCILNKNVQAFTEKSIRGIFVSILKLKGIIPNVIRNVA